ncbi:hypothetical protein [Caballeronia sp. LZ043]|uniref:hypothetical protein n=1 Tax=Caballeronia sp. LZ043 TaxID=3038569 RepID=UPI002860AEDE|nr:hypothetical protein [Caballeronia sp. LZ043]MDR5823707.1 hypothetical protein [Caballeronia sp. LZ043]
MNWRRLYAVIQILGTVGCISIAAAGLYSVILIGICRRLIGLSENVSVFAIGIPSFLLLLTVFVRYLPAHLRKAGMLSDAPEKFGPWFK